MVREHKARMQELNSKLAELHDYMGQVTVYRIQCHRGV
jgi:hypothetical protein